MLSLLGARCLHDPPHVVASDGVDCGGGPQRSLATIHRVEGAGDLPALPLHGIARAPISFQDLASLTETMAYPALEMEGTGQRVGEKASAMVGTDVLGVLGTVANGGRRAGATGVEMAAGQTLAVDAEEDDMVVVVVPYVGPTSCTFAAASPTALLCIKPGSSVVYTSFAFAHKHTTSTAVLVLARPIT